MTQLTDRDSALAGGNTGAFANGNPAHPLPAHPLTGAGNPASPLSDKVETAAMAAHKVADRLADAAMTQVDQLSGTAHRAVNRAADAATFAAEWAANVPDQAKQVQVRFTDSACAAVRAQPLQVVVGALVVGYLFGRFGRP